MSMRTLILTAFTTLSPTTGPPLAVNLHDIELPGARMASGPITSGGATSRGVQTRWADGGNLAPAGRSGPANTLTSEPDSQKTSDHGNVAGGTYLALGAHVGRSSVQTVFAAGADDFADTGGSSLQNSFESVAQAGAPHFETGHAGLSAGAQSWREGAVGGSPTFAAGGAGSGWALPRGQISGGSTGGAGDGAMSAVVAVSAVPEPETYAMMLAGFGLIGTIVRRRKKNKLETG